MQKYFFKELDSMCTQKLKRDEHGRIIISKRTGSTSMINKDTNGRIIIQSRKRNIAADTDPANTANRDLHHDYCLFEQEEDNVIDWGKPSISFKALHLLSNGDKPQTKKDKTKKDKKKKDKQRKKKQKYSYDKVFSKKNKSNLELQTLEEIKGKELTERKICISSVLSEIAAYYKNFLVNPQNEIYIYNEGEGFFEKKSNSEVEAYINSHLTQTQRMKTRPSDISDARKSIYNIQENRSELNNDYDCLVNCQNGVFNIETGDLLEHSIDYKFGRCIQAKYDPDANATVFPEFIKDACNGNEELIWLLQEVLGYAFSFSSCIKIAIIFYGPHDTGKSCILRMITNICGSENVSNINIQDYSNPCFAAQLRGKALNIAPDLPSSVIKDVSAFKTMVSGEDSTTTKALYQNPISTPCKSKHFFGANQFMQLDTRLSPQNIEAFLNRLLFIPFMNQKAPEDMNHNLSKELLEERDYIFTWAMQGLQRLYKNNWCFSKCKESDNILNEYRCQYSSEASFFSKYLEKSPNSILLTADVQDVYEKYAISKNIKYGKHDMVKYIKATHPGMYNSKKRCKGLPNGRAVYIGLRFKEDSAS